MLLASLSAVSGLTSAVSGLRAVSNLGYHPLPSTKISIYKLLTGIHSTPHASTVTWYWSEPETVGKVVTFGVRFFQKNGKPYPVSNTDGILIEITHQGVSVARTLGFPGTTLEDMNLVRCGFTVHKSGEYKISIMVRGNHVKDSPFTKCFKAGSIDPTKTGFMQYRSTVVIPSGTSYPLVIEPRDSFGNLSAYTAGNKAFFKIKIKQAGTKEWYSPTTQFIYSTQNKTLVMHFKIDRKGSYKAIVSYGDKMLSNGDLDILVLNAAEMNRVNTNITKAKHNLWYEARLLKQNGQQLERPKKVYVHTSQKHITVTEWRYKFYPRQLCKFRVCPWTKVSVNEVNNRFDTQTILIQNGSQTSVELAATDCSTIAAVYSCFLLNSLGGSESFKDKRDFFYKEIRPVTSRENTSHLALKIDRSHLLHSSCKVMRNVKSGDWYRRFEVSFYGEQGLDWGGLSREWFEMVCQELFDPNRSQLFTRLADNPQGLVHPNAKRPPDKKVKLFEFAGRIVGKCLFESSVGRTQLVKARFTRSFLAQLIGIKVTYKHFETDDPEYYATKISYIEHNSVEDMELTFSEEVFDVYGQLIKVVNLIPNGAKIAVTNSNKLAYLDALAQHRLVTPVRDEVQSFMRGLSSQIRPNRLLAIFNENELELLMCGTGTYSTADFKLHHMVVEVSSSLNKVLDWFWTIIASFSPEQMARLLQFTTGSSLLPPGGFSELNPMIQLSSVPTYNSLPSSHTCFNQLCLPDYDSMETFHKMLLLAITEGNQGFGMV